MTGLFAAVKSEGRALKGLLTAPSRRVTSAADSLRVCAVACAPRPMLASGAKKDIDLDLRSMRNTRERGGRRRSGRVALAIERLEARLAMTGVVISEFLASNASGITDEDGERQDWIELTNTSATPVDLAGWGLTDDAGDLAKWILPSTTLA